MVTTTQTPAHPPPPTELHGYPVILWIATGPRWCVVVVDRGAGDNPERYVCGEHEHGTEHWHVGEYCRDWTEAVAAAVARAARIIRPYRGRFAGAV